VVCPRDQVREDQAVDFHKVQEEEHLGQLNHQQHLTTQIVTTDQVLASALPEAVLVKDVITHLNLLDTTQDHATKAATARRIHPHLLHYLHHQ